MGRLGRILVVLLVVLAGLLVVNFFVLNAETKPAEVTADGGKIVEVQNADVQVFDLPATGSGPEGEPIVLLHCFGCSSQWWNKMVPLLNDGHRIIRIDLIGHGGSEKPKSGYEVTAQSAAVAEVMNQLGVTHATVIGHSLGGMVATSLAESASELVDRLVLIGVPAEDGAADFPLIAKLARAPVIGQAIWRVRIDSLIRKGYESAFAPGFDIESGFDNPDQVVDDNRAMTYTSYVDADTAAEDFLEEGAIPGRLTATGVPLLVIDGAEDQLFDAEEQLDLFQAVPGARVETIQGSGHSPNVEDPEAVAEVVLPFIDAGEPIVAPEKPKTPKSPSEPKPNPDNKKKQGAKKK